ncbi:hypothetical protein [Eoetvoesiella caeni]
MAHTAEDRAAVERARIAIASGERVTEIRFTDRLVKYADPPTLAELNELLHAIDHDLAAKGKRRIPFSGRTWGCAQPGKGL